jgi:ubiquinone/menaquinone biosynthesis C-methylase UbiE
VIDTPDPYEGLDRTADPRHFVQTLDIDAHNPYFQNMKRRSIALLDPAAGKHMLDVGCGIGEDVRAIARLVGESGSVLGIDISATMLEEARRRSAGSGLPVKFQLGDVRRLELEDERFDGCRIERVLLHLEDPAQALSELIRVARPGGRIVACEPDLETTVVDLPDRALTRAMLHNRTDHLRRSGWIGRQLPRLFRNAGLLDITVSPETVIEATYGPPTYQAWIPLMVRESVVTGVILAADAERWLGEIEQAQELGQFFLATTYFVVAGRKPGLSDG